MRKKELVRSWRICFWQGGASVAFSGRDSGGQSSNDHITLGALFLGRVGAPGREKGSTGRSSYYLFINSGEFDDKILLPRHTVGWCLSI